MRTFKKELRRRNARKKAPSSSSFSEVLKFNPYHGPDGRFTGPGGATSFTYKPGGGKVYDNAIAREKERTAAAATTPEEKRKKALADVEGKIRKQEYESACVIDKEGNQLLFKDGEKTEVSFNWQEVSLMKGATLTHNHPSSSTFSVEDVKIFVNRELQEIRAVGSNGNTHILRRVNEVKNTAFEFNTTNYEKESKFIESYIKKYSNSVRKAQADLDSRGFREKIRSGEITQEYANTEMRKSISNNLYKYLNRYAKNYGFEYSMEGEA